MRHLATDRGARAIFLFIAELNGYKVGTIDGKLAFGKQCYVSNHLHDLDYSTEDGRKDAHENIWLQRLYDDLDKYYQLGLLAPIRKSYVLDGVDTIDTLLSNPSVSHKWTVPIELDAGALA